MSISKLSKMIPTSSIGSRKSAPKEVHGPSPIPTKLPGEYPMRINKYLGWKGYSTRRGADELITKHMVTINGRFATLGDQVTEHDTVEVRNTKKPTTYTYYAYNKPRGVSTDPTRKGTLDISQSIPLGGVFPVGGLDVNAEGLVILTNDRRITDRLLNPTHEHVKEFLIHTLAPLRANFKEKMEGGVVINDLLPIYATVKIINDSLFALRITDSGSHIRQMCSMFFAEIESMKRTQILNITLGKLASNTFRKIEDEELVGFLKSLGL
jgi:23S rRNA pseudouridine2604 synthase